MNVSESELKQMLSENDSLADENPHLLAMPAAGGKTRTVPELLSLAEHASEHDAQAALFAWADGSGIPELEMLHATPNGGYRPAHVGAQMKQEGQKAGYPDISLDVARGRWHGLRIELKVGRNKPTQLQLDWLGRLRAEGYMAVVCYGFEDAKRTILAYLGLEE